MSSSYQGSIRPRQTKLVKDHRGFPLGHTTIDGHAWVKETIKEVLIDFEFGQDAWGPDKLEELEHRSRDGFIPHGHNKGGFDKNQFTDLYSVWGSGSNYSGKLGADIQKAIDEWMLEATKTFVEDNPEVLFNDLTEEQINYHDLYEAGLGQYAEMLSDYERSAIEGDQNSIMEQIRVMYHGQQGDLHSLTVFASVSWRDAPYHRSADAIEEKTITFANEKELRVKLLKALEETSEVFS